MVKKRAIATTATSAVIITIIVISTFSPNFLETDIIVEFSVNCEKDQIYIGESISCTISSISNIDGFIWDFHDDSNLVVLDDSETTISHTFQKTGTYFISVVGYNVYNLSAIDTTKVEVLEPFPNLVIKANTSTAYEDEPITFSTYNLLEGDNYTISWEFGDKTSKIGKVVEHSYNIAGNYVVRFVLG